MSSQSTVTSIMTRHETGFFAVLAWAIAVFLISLPSSGMAKIIGSATALLFGLVFTIGVLWPHRFQTGVVLFDGGFEHFAGLQGRRVVRFADIEKIVAVQTGGGQEGNEVMLEIFTATMTRVRLGEGDLFNTDLHDLLFKLHGFQHGQYVSAAQHQLNGLEHFQLKRFTVFERSASIHH